MPQLNGWSQRGFRNLLNLFVNWLQVFQMELYDWWLANLIQEELSHLPVQLRSTKVWECQLLTRKIKVISVVYKCYHIRPFVKFCMISNHNMNQSLGKRSWRLWKMHGINTFFLSRKGILLGLGEFLLRTNQDSVQTREAYYETLYIVPNYNREVV